MTWPAGFSRLELDPLFDIESARSRGGFAWETEESDPRWTGTVTTSKLNHTRLQRWQAFIAECIGTSAVIDFVDPVYYIPAAYRAVGVLPGAWDGSGVTIGDDDDTWEPVLAGLPVGLVLTLGDRLGFTFAGYKSYHMVRADLTVSSDTAQAVKIVPPLLPNVIETGATVSVLDPVLRLRIVPGTWRVPRAAGQDAVGSFQVEEATVQS
jgi:hypothetical protein